MKKFILPFLVISIILFCDQLLKYWVHTHIFQSHRIIFPNWFMLYYTENNGMAFGVEFGGIIGKITLTIFRILAVFGLLWYLVKQLNHEANKGFIICISLILAGAVGNIIDSVFYGVLYRSQSMPLFQGRVIDMLYFPVIDTYIPDWFPFWKGEHFEFFRPVFNIADASISTGIIAILVFQNRFFKHKESEINPDSSNLDATTNEVTGIETSELATDSTPENLSANTNEPQEPQEQKEENDEVKS